MTQTLRFVREPAILERTQTPRTTHRRLMASGLFTNPVKLAPRCVAWPEHEVDAILSARLAGASDEDVRNLVSQLHEQRAAAFTKVAA